MTIATKNIVADSGLPGVATPALVSQVILFDLLRRLFLQAGPNHDIADILAAAITVEDWPPAIADALMQMHKAIAARGNADDALLDLEVEFTRLTIGPLDIPALPYASFYLSPSHALMTEETLDVRRRYLEAGVAVRELGGTPDDHLGVELEFLHFLTLQAAHAEMQGEKTIRHQALARRDDFLRDHFERWVPMFSTALARATQEPMFKAVSDLLKLVACLYVTCPQPTDPTPEIRIS